jgi:hypothetical protein
VIGVETDAALVLLGVAYLATLWTLARPWWRAARRAAMGARARVIPLVPRASVPRRARAFAEPAGVRRLRRRAH